MKRNFALLMLCIGFLMAIMTPVFAMLGDPVDGGCPCCPVLYVWNGEEYVYEEVLHMPGPPDTIVIYTLTTEPESVNGMYEFRLVEDEEISHIDQVKLFAILENGVQITLPLVSATQSDENVLLPLLFSDDWKVDLLGAESIDLGFPSVDNIVEFIFQIEGYSPY